MWLLWPVCFFTEEPVVDYTTAKTSDTVRFSDIFSEC